MTETLQHINDLEISLDQVSYAEATFLASEYDMVTLTTVRPDQLIPAERQQACLNHLRTAVRDDANYGNHPTNTLEMLVRNKYALAVDSARAYAITSGYLQAVSEDKVTEVHTRALGSIRPGLIGRSPLLKSAVAQAWDGLASMAASAETSHKAAGYKHIITTLEPPREPLRQQLLAAIDAVHKADTAKCLSPVEDLNPLCELTEKLTQVTEGFGPEEVELHTKITGAILRRVNDTAPHDASRRQYKNILVAMGGEIDDPVEAAPVQKTSAAPAEARPLKAVAEIPKPSHQKTAKQPEDISEATIRWSPKRLGATAALAAVIVTPIAEAGTAVAAPSSVPAAKIVARAPLIPGATGLTHTAESSSAATTASEDDTAIIPKSAMATPLLVPEQKGGDINVIPNAHPGQSGQAENVPVAPSAGIAIGTTPPHATTNPDTVVPVGGTAGNTEPTLPGTDITVTNPNASQTPVYTPPTETTGPTGGTQVHNPHTVLVGGQAAVTPGSGQNIPVVPGDTAGASGGGSTSRSAAPPATPGDTAPDVTVTVPGNAAPDSPQTVIEPTTSQPTTEQSDQDMLEFYLQNGSSSDVIQQYGQILADKYQLTPSPDSAFLDMVNTTISQVDNGKADTSLVLAGVIAKYPAALTQLDGSVPASADSSFVTLMASQGLGSADKGLAGVDGQENYTDDDKTAIYTELAQGLADNTTVTEQAQMLEAMGISAVGVTAQPPAAPAPAPAPAPATPPKAAPTPAQPEHPAPNGAPKPPEILTPQQLELKAASMMSEKGGTWENRGKLHTLARASGFTDIAAWGAIGNLDVESAGLNPHQVQMGYGPNSPNLPRNIMGIAGYGLAQWTFLTRQEGLIEFAKARGTNEGDLETQWLYIMHELSKNPAILEKMNAAKTVSEAALIWRKMYENPSVHNDTARIDRAHKGANEFDKILTGLKNQQNSAIRKYHHDKADYDKAQRQKAAEKKATHLEKPATAPFEYILRVPKDGNGHDVYYANQVTNLNGIDGINGYNACGLASTLVTLASLTHNPDTSVSRLHQGLLDAGAYSDSDGVLNTDKLLSFIKNDLGLNEHTILYERTSPTTDTVMSKVRGALDKGQVLIVHTSTKVSGVDGRPTDGHYLVMYAYDDQGYYVANVGERDDSPVHGHVFTQNQIQNWLDGFYAISN